MKKYWASSVIYILDLIAIVSGQDFRCSEGECRPAEAGYEICASQKWQRVMTEHYICVNASIVPLQDNPIETMSRTIVTSHFSAPTTASSGTTGRAQTSSDYVAPPAATAEGPIGETGYSYCANIKNTVKDTASGRASYTPGGKMASVYIADRSSTFRCDGVPYPDDDFYVAFWTQWSADLEGRSQPAPTNCGQKVALTNPKTGRMAEAVVIDRCASCVGVNNSPDDPTLALNLVNGATVDLSQALWNFLYDGEALGVFDIAYDGDPYTGWSQSPKALRSSASQC